MDYRKSVLACAAVAMLAGSAPAASIDSTAFGSDMAGALATVFWTIPGGPVVPITRPWFVSGPAAGKAIVPDPIGAGGLAEFDIIGDTFSSTWSIANMSDWFILRVEYDLRPSISLFDDSPANPDTPLSGLGVDGVVYVGGTAPAHVASDEFTPWAFPKNAGDEWWQEFIAWTGPGTPGAFAPFTTFLYQDDTDVVPAPGAAALLALAGLVGTRRRR